MIADIAWSYYMAWLDKYSFLVWVDIDLFDQLDESITDLLFHTNRPKILTIYKYFTNYLNYDLSNSKYMYI